MGRVEGTAIGANEGTALGDMVDGQTDGTLEGALVVGQTDGADDGTALGRNVGREEGTGAEEVFF